MKGPPLDQGLPRSTTKLLIESGFAALHAADVGLSRASDPEILEYARTRDLIVVTLDADFHLLIASTGAVAPSVIRLRRQRLNADQAATVIQAVLELGYEILDGGAVASVTKASIRFKRLPPATAKMTSAAIDLEQFLGCCNRLERARLKPRRAALHEFGL